MRKNNYILYTDVVLKSEHSLFTGDALFIEGVSRIFEFGKLTAKEAVIVRDCLYRNELAKPESSLLSYIGDKKKISIQRHGLLDT